MGKKIFFVFLLLLAVSKINAQVTVTSSDSISCSTLCTTLTAHVTGDAPTNTGINADDQYPATVQPIGFSFNYYGITYTSCVIGPNGTIDFDLTDAGAYADYTISTNLASDPTLLNSIAGPYCDIDITAGVGGIITYSTTGTAPFRKFIVSFCSDPMFSCEDQLTTTQIILYETTNIIETHIGTKLICAWNGGFAIIGVKNATGTASTAAPGRDYPNVYTCTNEAWRFSPDAAYANYTCSSIPYAPIPIASSLVYWYNNNTGAFLGTGLTQTVCPTTTTTYRAGALTCSDTSFGFYTVVPSAVVVANFVQSAPLVSCGSTTSITVSGLMADSVYTVYYTFNGTPTSFTVTASPTGTVIITGAGAGNYTNMYVSHGICNSGPQSLVITEPGVIANFAVFAPIVNCGSTTSITVSGMMPDSVYTVYYTFNGVPASFTATASSTGTIIINSAAAGNYTNMYVAQHYCTSAPQSLTIAPPPITISATPYNPSVCGYSDGRIVLNGYWPNTGYSVSYTKDGVPVAASLFTSNAAGSITIPSLNEATYTNIISVGGPCPPTSVAGPVVLTNPAPPTLTVDSAYVKTCIGIPVQLHAYSSMPSITEYYSWSPATDLSNPAISNPVVTPVVAGNVAYVVTGTPSPGVAECNATATLTVHAIAPPVIATAPATICLLTPRMSVAVTVTEPFDPEIHYTWAAPVAVPADNIATPTSQNPTITPNTGGLHVYTLTTTYAACPAYVNTYAIQVDTQARGLVVRDTICLGMSDVIDMSSTGGPGYHYLWTSSPAGVVFSNDTIAAPSFTPPAIGPYVLSISVTSPNNAAGCGSLDSVLLLVLPNTLTITPVDTAICLGQVVQVSGTIPYSTIFNYQWLPTAGIANPTTLNALITPDTAQLYTVSASFHRCPDIYATLNLDVQPNPTVYLGGNRPVCDFDTLHLHAAVAPAWYSNYTYSWTPATVLDMTTAQNAVFIGHVSTNVVLTVTTPAGCTAKDSAFITVNPGNFGSVVSGDDFCPHESKQVSITTTGTTATYQWFPSMYVDDAMSASPTVSPITTQTYTIVGTSADGCRDTVYWTATVYPDAVIELGDSLALFPGESFPMNPLTNCVTFVWFPVTGLSNPFISDPVATPDVSTEYIVTGVTEHGCIAKDSIAIYVNEESVLGMPNAFVPGNGPNSYFKVKLRGIAHLNYFRVYNRWGNLMFETKNISEGWDGSYKGEPQDVGVYVYDVQAVTSTGKVIQKTGNVTLLK